jgi:lysophospholipase L1-like esterase
VRPGLRKARLLLLWGAAAGGLSLIAFSVWAPGFGAGVGAGFVLYPLLGVTRTGAVLAGGALFVLAALLIGWRAARGDRLTLRDGAHVLFWPATFVLVVFAAELFQRLIEPAQGRYFMFPPQTERVIRLDPAVIHGVKPAARFVVNEYGLRGEPPPTADARRLLVLGGSMVEGLAQDDAETSAAHLQRLANAGQPERRVWVGNAGRSGLTSFEHVIQLRHLPGMLPPLDSVIVVAGVNDLAYGYVNAAARERRAVSEEERYDRTFYSIVRPQGGFPHNLALYRLYLSVERTRGLAGRGVLQNVVGESSSYTEWVRTSRLERARARPHVDATPDLAPYLAIYRDNLNRLADMAAARGVKLVLVTQPLMYRAGQSAKEEAVYGAYGKVEGYTSKGESRYYSSGSLDRMIRMYDAVMLQVCKARGLACIDAAAEMPPSAELYYDGLHLTDQGAARFAAIVHAGLERTGVLPRP